MEAQAPASRTHYECSSRRVVDGRPTSGGNDSPCIGLNKHGEETGVSLQRMAELLAGATRWRWLLVDEISMVSAELLARLELRCQELVRDACKEKYGPNSNAARPFGGLNVILAGDMWQLEPPRGTFLGAIADVGRKPSAFRELQNWCAASARKMRG